MPFNAAERCIYGQFTSHHFPGRPVVWKGVALLIEVLRWTLHTSINSPGRRRRWRSTPDAMSCVIHVCHILTLPLWVSLDAQSQRRELSAS